MKRLPLDPQRIVSAAFAIADISGLDALTMRRLADALSVTPMALYKHVANRQELVDLMVDALVAEIPSPNPTGEWALQLRAQIVGARDSMRQHPWAQSAIESRTVASPLVLGYMDSLMAIMFDGGLSADLVHHAMHALSTRMWGFTRDVMPTPTAPADPEEREAAIEEFARHYPAIFRMATTAPHAGEACDDDLEFAFALDLLIDGFERLHASRWSSE